MPRLVGGVAPLLRPSELLPVPVDKAPDVVVGGVRDVYSDAQPVLAGSGSGDIATSTLATPEIAPIHLAGVCTVRRVRAGDMDLLTRLGVDVRSHRGPCCGRILSKTSSPCYMGQIGLWE